MNSEDINRLISDWFNNRFDAMEHYVDEDSNRQMSKYQLKNIPEVSGYDLTGGPIEIFVEGCILGQPGSNSLKTLRVTEVGSMLYVDIVQSTM